MAATTTTTILESLNKAISSGAPIAEIVALAEQLEVDAALQLPAVNDPQQNQHDTQLLVSLYCILVAAHIISNDLPAAQQAFQRAPLQAHQVAFTKASTAPALASSKGAVAAAADDDETYSALSSVWAIGAALQENRFADAFLLLAYAPAKSAELTHIVGMQELFAVMEESIRARVIKLVELAYSAIKITELTSILGLDVLQQNGVQDVLTLAQKRGWTVDEVKGIVMPNAQQKATRLNVDISQIGTLVGTAHDIATW
ncbi:hypothetical protein GQ42DRAFT_20244 [Ramicandelaber brevisporus]|nr:hypothetical protein GQ42DRAFT_20244 [Ramicandelaber brevisporus]